MLKPGTVQPKFARRFFAKISPKPNITPFMKGNTKFIESDDSKARPRACTVRLESKMDSVADVGAGAVLRGSSSCFGCVGEGGEGVATFEG